MLPVISEIKELRERSARSALMRERLALENCLQAIEKAKQTLADYTDWRVLEERRLYADILGSNVDMKALEKVKYEIGILRLEEASLYEQVEQAKQNKVKAEEDLRLAQHAFKEAGKAVEKCRALTENLAQEELARTERTEESELEEAAAALSMRIHF